MKLYIRNRHHIPVATGNYDKATNKMTVLAGSRVSKELYYGPSFRGDKKIKRLREAYTVDGVMKDDLVFTSPTVAANFVIGYSCNGHLMWRDAEGRSLKELLTERTR